MLLKMTEEPDDFEGVWPTEENGVTIDGLRKHLRLGGMVAAIADVRALMAAHDALAERAADADRDYADMRRFQAKYVEADHARLALIAERDALRADAERYRWLAAQGKCLFGETDDVWDVPGELARQIDAAIARDHT